MKTTIKETERKIVTFDQSTFNSQINTYEALYEPLKKLIAAAKQCDIDLGELKADTQKLFTNQREFLCGFLPDYKLLLGKVNVQTLTFESQYENLCRVITEETHRYPHLRSWALHEIYEFNAEPLKLKASKVEEIREQATKYASTPEEIERLELLQQLGERLTKFFKPGQISAYDWRETISRELPKHFEFIESSKSLQVTSL